MNIALRRTTVNDLDFVIATEQAEQDSGFIGQWSWHEHRDALTDLNQAHFIVERVADGRAVGYVILQDLENKYCNLHLRRIVVAEKGKGYGRSTLQCVKKIVFEEYGAYRLWLDVKSYNPRALALYQSEGFVVEGRLRDCVQLEERHRLFREQGQRRASLILMSLLRPEYEATFSTAHLFV